MKIRKPKKQGLNRESATQNSVLLLKDCSFPVRFQTLGNDLTEAEKKVGKYFLGNPKAAYLSITEVVEDSALGYGTIIRFCRKLGCAGFQEFKVLLAQELVLQESNFSQDKSDAIAAYAEKIKAELSNTRKLIDEKIVIAVAEKVNNAEHILIAGIAGSASTAVGFDYRLSRIGMKSLAVCEGFKLAIRAVSLQPDDVFFAISFSGATKDILSAAEIAKKRGAIVISLTNFVRAPLVELADFSLFSSTQRDPLSCEIFSNISSDFVLDVLFSQLYKIHKNAEEMVKKTFQAVSNKRV